MTIKKFKNINLKGFKLIVGSASIGNAGQLTCDLLIESLKLEKYGMVKYLILLVFLIKFHFLDAF